MSSIHLTPLDLLHEYDEPRGVQASRASAGYPSKIFSISTIADGMVSAPISNQRGFIKETYDLAV
jgi:hypothetical protein